jgi:hypothetical protein
MEVQLTPDQQALVSEAIASGRLQRPEEAMQQALLLWEKRERRRLEILAAVDLSKAALARGEGRIVTTPEESDQLVSDITRRGMARRIFMLRVGLFEFLLFFFMLVSFFHLDRVRYILGSLTLFRRETGLLIPSQFRFQCATCRRMPGSPTRCWPCSAFRG